MKVDLAKYADMKICVAVSGGRDSMALLHYLYAHGAEYGIGLSALNCDHNIRGEASARDSAFVKEWCALRGIPLISFSKDCVALANVLGVSLETAARNWRRECYLKAIREFGADAVATAHHLNDNAETVIFNLARGSALAGLTGIKDDARAKIIRPLISCSRGDIDGYIAENGVPFVDDESNLSDDYTRNYIRHNVLPELENAVPNAAKAVYRFSRIAAEDEEYFDGLIEERKLIAPAICGVEIKFCKEKPVFRRAAVKVIKDIYCEKDYTLEQLERLYGLQFAENGKRFEFLKLTAYKEEGKIAVCKTCEEAFCVPFNSFKSGILGGVRLEICENGGSALAGALRFDRSLIPETAVIRTMKAGDRFTKFGGGSKNLGDFFTDRKIPVRLRGQIPLIADGSEILAVCGVEISDKIKISDSTREIGCIICADYAGFVKN